MNEPAITWNLVVTAVGFPLLGWFIKYLFDKQERLREQVQAEWRSNLVKELSRLCGRLDQIEKAMVLKLDKEEYEKKSDDKWEMIQHHTHDDRGRVVVP